MLEQAGIKSETRTPHGPLIDPANWRGPDITRRNNWVYRLEDADVTALEAALLHVERAGASLVSLTRDAFPLGHFADKLKAIKRQLNEGRGFVIIRGLPVGRYTRRQAEMIHWGIGLHLGEPVVTNSNCPILTYYAHVVGEDRQASNGASINVTAQIGQPETGSQNPQLYKESLFIRIERTARRWSCGGCSLCTATLSRPPL
ncbi:hypothetical protein JJC00_08065 [Bradyrhizobium diazoefficiens]|uniref:hypothetical protein n=1 Tax=Bradyrhizobium diazoefficiens TaxID=1355477 RepID=UPI00190B807C|nr:hypothetical protein [Bradyrhizobium diazoefficiens]QQO35558.1 hypothetical protein JJC00_08065 [Bradyrhizobium diazoefficiens]